MTFSIVARCSETGRFGVAISSSSPAVAARCAHVRAGVGAIATQNITDPRLGPQGLDLLAKGLGAVEAVEALRQTAPYADYRQILAIDRAGSTAEFSGAHALGVHASLAGRDCLAAGNLLAGPQVILAVIAGFEHDAHADLGDRLIAAMQAGLAAGGEAGPLHSAGLLIADKEAWPVADLRVDWTDGDPIGELTSLWQLWKPQMNAYVTRALDPRQAPSYGVPGNL